MTQSSVHSTKTETTIMQVYVRAFKPILWFVDCSGVPSEFFSVKLNEKLGITI